VTDKLSCNTSEQIGCHLLSWDITFWKNQKVFKLLSISRGVKVTKVAHISFQNGLSCALRPSAAAQAGRLPIKMRGVFFCLAIKMKDQPTPGVQELIFLR
jgi:hypothetical protein